MLLHRLIDELFDFSLSLLCRFVILLWFLLNAAVPKFGRTIEVTKLMLSN